jgi:hypothetical protein
MMPVLPQMFPTLALLDVDDVADEQQCVAERRSSIT